MSLNRIFMKRKGSIARAESQVSDFIAAELLNETGGKHSLRHMSCKRESKVADSVHSDKLLGQYTQKRLVEGFEDQKNLLRNATRKPYETLKFRMTDGCVMSRVPRKSNCVKTVLHKLRGIDSSLLSQDDMTQSGICLLYTSPSPRDS